MLVGLVLSSFLQQNPPLKYMQVATIKNGVAEEESRVTTYKDSLTNDLVIHEYPRITFHCTTIKKYKEKSVLMTNVGC